MLNAITNISGGPGPQHHSRVKGLTTLSVTTASAERTIAMLRRLKTWLRSTMAEDRLTGLALHASCTFITVTLYAILGCLDIFFRTSRRIKVTD